MRKDTNSFLCQSNFLFHFHYLEKLKDISQKKRKTAFVSTNKKEDIKGLQQLKWVFSSVLAAVETTPKIMFKLLSCCIILSLLPYHNAQRVQKFDIEVDSAVKWSTNILRSKGNHFPGGPTLSARHTSLNALVKKLLSHSDNFFNGWSHLWDSFWPTSIVYISSVLHT